MNSMVPEFQQVIDQLVAQGAVERGQIDAKRNLLIEVSRDRGFARALAEVGGLNEETIVEAFCKSHGVARMAVSIEIEHAPGGLFTEDELRQDRFLPIFRSGMEMTIAVVEPKSKEFTLKLLRVTGCHILYVGTTVSDLEAAYRKYRGMIDKIQSIASKVRVEDYDIRVMSKKAAETMSESEAKVTLAQVVDELLLRAAKKGASDIHIEPMTDEVMVRFRVDGVLQRHVSFHKEFHAGIVSVVKSRSGMDMFERLIPQDGRMTLNFADREFDVRVSSLPVGYGEKLVLRLLGKTSMITDLSGIGLNDANLSMMRSLMKSPSGIILVTGPTGSGKTTTLYAALNELRSIGKNITTIENPIEYRLALVNQTQVSTERGVTFASALRAILRQDPNIILVGEIRDAETGRIATEAAMTGHLVLSTLHTNDSIGAIPRLVNLGIESFWVGTSMIGVVAQRLVRRLCMACKVEFEPTREYLAARGLAHLPKGTTLFRSKGCPECEGIGYRGRLAIHEILSITEEMRDVISKDLTTSNLRNIARATDFRDMYFDGIQKSIAGITSVEEIERVTVRVI